MKAGLTKGQIKPRSGSTIPIERFFAKKKCLPDVQGGTIDGSHLIKDFAPSGDWHEFPLLESGIATSYLLLPLPESYWQP